MRGHWTHEIDSDNVSCIRRTAGAISYGYSSANRGLVSLTEAMLDVLSYQVVTCHSRGMRRVTREDYLLHF